MSFIAFNAIISTFTVKDLERENDAQKGDVAKMERETGRDNCKPSKYFYYI
jgi:hypothetical protein